MSDPRQPDYQQQDKPNRCSLRTQTGTNRLEANTKHAHVLLNAELPFSPVSMGPAVNGSAPAWNIGLTTHPRRKAEITQPGLI